MTDAHLAFILSNDRAKACVQEAELRVAGALLLPVPVYQETDIFVHKLFSPVVLVFIIMETNER